MTKHSHHKFKYAGIIKNTVLGTANSLPPRIIVRIVHHAPGRINSRVRYRIWILNRQEHRKTCAVYPFINKLSTIPMV